MPPCIKRVRVLRELDLDLICGSTGRGDQAAALSHKLFSKGLREKNVKNESFIFVSGSGASTYAGVLRIP